MNALATLLVKALPIVALTLLSPATLLAEFAPGEVVRLRREEPLKFKGKVYQTGTRGQEFTVLKVNESERSAYVPFVTEDRQLIAVTIPEAALEKSPRIAWEDLVLAAETLRAGKVDDAAKTLEKIKPETASGDLAKRIRTELTKLVSAGRDARKPGALPAYSEAFTRWKTMVKDVATEGCYGLAVVLDEAGESLTARAFGTKPPEAYLKQFPSIDKADLRTKATKSTLGLALARQFYGLSKLAEAMQAVDEALLVEPGRGDLKILASRIREEGDEVGKKITMVQQLRNARDFSRALDITSRAVKLAPSNTELSALKDTLTKELEGAITPAPDDRMASASGSDIKRLTEGWELYKNRCFECHDLDNVEKRTADGWAGYVRKMAGKAKLKGNQESLISEYLAAARSDFAKNGPRKFE
jgi:tetratricopeptide (TPR) repeat protein